MQLEGLFAIHTASTGFDIDGQGPRGPVVLVVFLGEQGAHLHHFSHFACS